MNTPLRTALVTGASRGIGLGVATRLARNGWGLSISARQPERLADVAQTLKQAGSPQVLHHAVDLADEDAPETLIQLHEDAFGAMNALILNAGVGTVGRAADFPKNRLTKTLQVNLMSSIQLTQQALPLLRKGAVADTHRGAYIVGLSSITGVYADTGYSIYGASKAALLRYLEAVNQEESGAGVRATSLAPAYVSTDMTAWIADTVPLEAMIPVEDVVEVVDMLLRLSRTAGIGPIVMTRSGTTGFQA
jgi:3-oxoacyl-[acyl-carrier protein] reductase